MLLGDDALYAELGYTGLTRGTHENHLYTVVGAHDLEAGEDGLAQLVKALGTSHAKTAAIDYLERSVASRARGCSSSRRPPRSELAAE